jgi:membrane protein
VGKQKYAGSWAEYLWNRLNAADFINQGMLVVFSFFFSGMVISENNEYGPIGTIFAVMTFLIVIGVVIILGAVVGLVWQERGLSFAAAFRKLRRAS